MEQPGPRGRSQADSFPLTAPLLPQPREHDLSWVGGPEPPSPAGWPEMAFPGDTGTRSSLNGSIFGNKVSYIHMDSSSGDWQVICMVTDIRKLLEITAPHTPEVQGVTWALAFANFRPTRKGHALLAGSTQKHTTCGKKR